MKTHRYLMLPRAAAVIYRGRGCGGRQVRAGHHLAGAVQGLRDPEIFRIIDRLDARGRAYYWIGVERRRAKPPEGSDLWAVRCNRISVTPLCLDYTDQATRESLSRVLGDGKASERVSQVAREAPEPGRVVHSHRE